MLTGLVGLALGIVSIVAMLSSAASVTPEASDRALAERLADSTWALAVPVGWLAAPVAEMRPGDSVDLLAVRLGERPLAVAIAADLRLMAFDDRAVVFEVDEESATAIATARASGLLIVPLLRSVR